MCALEGCGQTAPMLAEWIAISRRASKEFLADDCMGLAKEVSYSALLAFFPAAAFLLGLFGVLHLYDQMQSFLATVAPHGVITFIDGLQRDQSGGTKVLALVARRRRGDLGGERRDDSVIKAVNRAYERKETRPFWQVRLIAIVLVLLTGVTLVALAVLIVFGGPLGQAIADKAQPGRSVHRGLEPAALADRVRRRAAALRLRLHIRAERGRAAGAG